MMPATVKKVPFMTLIGKRSLSRVLEIGTIVLLFIIPMLVIALPWLITLATGRTPEDPQGYYYRYLITLTYSGVLTELILWQARGIMHNVNTGKVFSANTVRRMRIMAAECYVLALAYLATMVWMHKFFMAVLFVCFVMFGCTLLVFSELFRQANRYKEENDMTI
ncbi:MAG: DUF2975 domain-containing protein [Ruminococcaceae bacterium]|nr:DUF2975 domain-containing protein [Oscillospiraceae bacterium]